MEFQDGDYVARADDGTRLRLVRARTMQPLPTSLQRAAGKSRRGATNLAAPTRRSRQAGCDPRNRACRGPEARAPARGSRPLRDCLPSPAQRALALCLCVRDPRGRTVRFRVRHALRPDRVDPSGNPGDVGSAVSGRHRRGGEDAREASGMNDGLDEPARLGGHRRRATRRDSSAVRLEPGQPAYPRGTLLADPGAESPLVRTLERRGLQPTHPDGRSGIHLDRGGLYRAARP